MFEAGSVFVRVGALFSPEGFQKWDRAVEQTQRHKEIKANLGATYDSRQVRLYNEALDKLKAKTERKNAYKASLGANYDPRAFNQMERDLARTQKATGRMHETTNRLTSSFKQAAKGAVGLAAGYFALSGAKDAIATTEELGKATILLQRNFGLTTKAAGEWAAVAKSRDVDPSALHMGFTKLSKSVEAASGEYDKQKEKLDALGTSQVDQAKHQALVTAGAGKNAAALKELGLTQADIRKGQTDFNFLLEKVTTGFSNLKGGTDRAALAQTIFGRGARTLLPLFRQGAQGFEGQSKQAEKYGAVLTSVGVKNTKDLIVAQREAKFATMGLEIAFSEHLAPTLVKTIGWANSFVLKMKAARDGQARWKLITDALSTGLKKILTDVLPRVASQFGQAAPGIAVAFVKGFLSAGVWGQLAIGGLLINKFKLWPALFRKLGLASGVAAGEGAAAGVAASSGKFAGAFGKLKVAGGVGLATVLASLSARSFANSKTSGFGLETTGGGFKSMIRDLEHWGFQQSKAETETRKFGDTAEKMFAKLKASGNGRAVENLALQARSLASENPKAAKSLNAFADSAEAAAHPLMKLSNDIGFLRHHAATDMKTVKETFQSNMNIVANTLGTQSARGQQRLSQNMRAAIGNVKALMRNGVVTTQQGMAQIQSIMSQTLRQFGFSPKEALNIAKGHSPSGGPDEGSAGPTGTGTIVPGHEAGGFIGGRGERGPDDVSMGLPPAWAVINGEQQKVLRAGLGMMGMPSPFARGGLVPVRVGRGEYVSPPGEQGVFDAAAAAMGYGGLAGLFERVRRPHWMAGGGIAGMLGAANQLDRAHFPYVWGGGHGSSPARFGPMDCSGAVSYVLQHGGVGIPTMVSGALARAGRAGPGAVTVFANPVHTFMRIMGRYFGTSGSNPGGGAGWMPDPGAGYRSRFSVRHFLAGSGPLARLRRLVVGGPASPMHSAVQAALDVSERGAQRYLNRTIASQGGGAGGDIGDGGPAIRGKFSTFGPPTEAAGRTATGASSSQPGIAIFDRSRLGKMFRVVLGGHAAQLRQTDIGPAPWTGRKVDVTGAGSRAMGIDPRRFPTDHVGAAFPMAGGGFTSGSFGGGKSGFRSGAFGGGNPVFRLRARLAGLKRQVPGTQHEIDRAEKKYAHFEEVYNRSDEQFVVSQPDGTQVVDQNAVNHRLGELSTLIKLRQDILRLYRRYAKEVAEIVKSIKTVIKGIRAALKAAQGKDRPGLRRQLSNSLTELGNWQDTGQDVGWQVEDSGLDLQELRDEATGLKSGTTVAGLLGASGQAGGGSGSGSDNPDLAAQLAQAQGQIAALTASNKINTAALQTFGGPGDIGAGGRTAYLAGGGSAAPGSGGFADPHGSTLTSLGGSGAGFQNSGGVTQIIQTLHPADSRTLAAIAEAANRGNSRQGYIPRTRFVSGV